MKEILEKIQTLKSDMRSMLEKAETEKRNLTEDENTQFERLKEEKRMLEFKLECENDTQGNPEQVDIRSIFAKNLSTSIEDGNKSTKIDVRSSIPINSADVVDTIPVLYKDILKVLEPMLIVDKVGVKMQTNVQGQPVWPTVGNVEAQILGENAKLDDSSIDFGKISASPKRAGVTIRLSRRAINQSNLNLYDIVVQSIAEAMAKMINKWLASPTAIATGCKGVFVKEDGRIIPLSAKPTLEEIVSLETAVLGANVNGEKGLYVLGTAMAGKLKTKPIEAGSPRMVLEGSEMNAYDVIKTNLMPSNCIGFGYFEYAVISQFGDFSLIVDPYTLATSNEIRFTGNSEYDITVLREEAFALGKVVTVPTIYATPATALLKTKPTIPVTKEITVLGLNLTTDVTVAVAGANAALFAVSAAKVTKDANGRADTVLTVTYTPTAVGDHAAEINLTATGATAVKVTLTGKAV